MTEAVAQSLDTYGSTGPESAGRISTPMVAALEQAWAAIRARHPDIPAVVVVLGEPSRSRPGSFTRTRSLPLAGRCGWYRSAELAGCETRKPGPPACVCDCGRRIRVAPAVLEAGPITCGVCGSDFEADQS